MKHSGERVYLRPILKKDLALFVKLMADSEVVRHTIMKSPTMKEELEWYRQIKAQAPEKTFAICLKEDDRLIGSCGIHDERHRGGVYRDKTFVGIMLCDKNEWGKGYGMDAMKTLLHYCKEKFGLKEVYLSVDTVNLRAQKSYFRCGFQMVEKHKNPDRVNSNGEEYVMRVEL